jgi:hypothetical protein
MGLAQLSEEFRVDLVGPGDPETKFRVKLRGLGAPEMVHVQLRWVGRNPADSPVVGLHAVHSTAGPYRAGTVLLNGV